MCHHNYFHSAILPKTHTCFHSESKHIVAGELSVTPHDTDTGLTPSTGISEVQCRQVAYHVNLNASCRYLLLQRAEDLNKQCRWQTGWADKAKQTKALTVSWIRRSYLHNLPDTDSFMVIQWLCGCLKRGHTSKPPDSSPPSYHCAQ